MSTNFTPKMTYININSHCNKEILLTYSLNVENRVIGSKTNFLRVFVRNSCLDKEEVISIADSLLMLQNKTTYFSESTIVNKYIELKRIYNFYNRVERILSQYQNVRLRKPSGYTEITPDTLKEFRKKKYIELSRGGG